MFNLRRDEDAPFPATRGGAPEQEVVRPAREKNVFQVCCCEGSDLCAGSLNGRVCAGSGFMAACCVAEVLMQGGDYRIDDSRID